GVCLRLCKEVSTMLDIVGTEEDLTTLSIDELRRLKNVLVEQDSMISYWRQVIQVRIEILHNQRLHKVNAPNDKAEEFAQLVAATVSRFGQVKLPLSGGTASLPAIPQLEQFDQQSHSGQRSDAENHQLLRGLLEAKTDLLAQHQDLQQRI